MGRLILLRHTNGSPLAPNHQVNSPSSNYGRRVTEGFLQRTHVLAESREGYSDVRHHRHALMTVLKTT